MGAETERPPLAGHDGPVWVLRSGLPVQMTGAWEIELEDGGKLSGSGALPADLPLGYHCLGFGARQVSLIVSPGRCHLPIARTWGWAVQLYAMRSAASWGMGDLGDLARLGEWSAAQGAGMVMVNPLHASIPGEASPYYPSSRCWYDPAYLDMSQVPGAPRCPGGLDTALVDRGAIWQAKRAGLEWAWERSRDDSIFRNWLCVAPASLATYARFAALSETQPGPWPTWPESLRRPDGTGAGEAPAERVEFHMWLQWLLDVQLARVGDAVDLVTDLAVGVSPDGADTWMWQDCFALGARVGAPPDFFNPGGQNWGLPPFDPWRLRAAGFEPFIAMLRAALRRARGVRIDHVMGMFRLWWVPPGASATEGAYVRYPAAEMLDILALESTRSQAFVVGEDLGTVEDSIRHELGERAVLSYRLLWFEPEPPGPAWPVRSMAAVTTHDLPTLVGCWSGADVAEQAELGLHPDETSMAATRDRVAAWAGLDPHAPVEDVIVAVHELVARAPSMLVVGTLEDALGVERRPNIPGTTSAKRANWAIPLPARLEQIMQDPVVAEVAKVLGRRRSGVAGEPTGTDRLA